MTRQEFVDQIGSWDDLIDFCCDEGYEQFVDDIFDDDCKDDYINAHLEELFEELGYSYQFLQQFLKSIPTGYDFYSLDKDIDEFVGLGFDDLRARKEEVLQALDDDGYFDKNDKAGEKSKNQEGGVRNVSCYLRFSTIHKEQRQE